MAQIQIFVDKTPKGMIAESFLKSMVTDFEIETKKIIIKCSQEIYTLYFNSDYDEMDVLRIGEDLQEFMSSDVDDEDILEISCSKCSYKITCHLTSGLEEVIAKESKRNDK